MRKSLKLSPTGPSTLGHFELEGVNYIWSDEEEVAICRTNKSLS